MPRVTSALGWIAALALAGSALSAGEHWAERHVLPSYCATSRPEAWVARSLPWLLWITAVCAAGVLLRAARRASWAAARRRAGAVVGIAAAVAASLCVTELYMRRLHQRIALGEPPDDRVGQLPMARVDARLGWSYLPGRTTWVEIGGRRIAYDIDADGNRAAARDEAPDRGRPTLLFTGESIAFGYGVPYEETLPRLVGRDLGLQAINLAVEAYGSDQAYLRAVDALAQYRRPVALVTLFLPKQIRRNVESWRPRLALRDDGALQLVAPSRGLRLGRLLGQLPWHDDEALAVTAAVLRATADAARARGAFPLFLVTNYGHACLAEDGTEPWVVEELFVRQGLPFVRVDLEPADLLPGALERHPGLRGMRKLAAAVEGALKGAVPPEALRDAAGARGTPP